MIHSKKYKKAEKFYRKLIKSDIAGIEKDLQLVYFDAMFTFLHKKYDESTELCDKILKINPGFKKARKLRERALIKLESKLKKQKLRSYYDRLPVIKKLFSLNNSDFVIMWNKDKILKECDIDLFKSLMPDYVKLINDAIEKPSEMLGIETSIKTGSMCVLNDDSVLFVLGSSRKHSTSDFVKSIENPDIDVYEIGTDKAYPQVKIGELQLAIVEHQNILFGSCECVENVLFGYGRNIESFEKIELDDEILTIQSIINCSVERFREMGFISDGILKLGISEKSLNIKYYSNKFDRKASILAFKVFDLLICNLIKDVKQLNEGGINIDGKDLSDNFSVLVKILKKRKNNISDSGFSIQLTTGKNLSMSNLMALVIFSKKAKIDYYFKNRTIEKCQKILQYIGDGLETFKNQKGYTPRDIMQLISNEDIDSDRLNCPSGVEDAYSVDDFGHARCKVHGSIDKPIIKK